MTDQAVSGLGSSGDLVGTELLYSDNGSNDVKVTPDKILAYVKNALTGGDDLGALALLDSADNAHLANMANSTIKGRTSAGTGAPEDMTAAQLAAILNTVGGVMKSKVIGTTYDISTATGTQAITGVGFKPTSVVLFIATSTYVSIGFADSGKTARCIATAASGSGWDWSTSVLGLIFSSSGNNQKAAVNSYDSDGLTIGWTKTGSPTGTAQLFLLCLR